jgi:hypothetical protein
MENPPDILFLNKMPADTAVRKVLIEKFPIGLKHVLKIKWAHVSKFEMEQAAIVRDYELKFYGIRK